MDNRNIQFLDAATSVLLIVDHQANLYNGIVSHKPSVRQKQYGGRWRQARRS
jgi:hypothetical protein